MTLLSTDGLHIEQRFCRDHQARWVYEVAGVLVRMRAGHQVKVITEEEQVKRLLARGYPPEIAKQLGAAFAREAARVAVELDVGSKPRV